MRYSAHPGDCSVTPEFRIVAREATLVMERGMPRAHG